MTTPLARAPGTAASAQELMSALRAAVRGLLRGQGRPGGRDSRPSLRPGTAACSACGHLRAAHEHLRRGTDCSACPCERYRGSLARVARVARRRGGRRSG